MSWYNQVQPILLGHIVSKHVYFGACAGDLLVLIREGATAPTDSVMGSYDMAHGANGDGAQAGLGQSAAAAAT